MLPAVGGWFSAHIHCFCFLFSQESHRLSFSREFYYHVLHFLLWFLCMEIQIYENSKVFNVFFSLNVHEIEVEL